MPLQDANPTPSFGGFGLIQKPTGLRYTIVNGAVTFEGTECTGALPGKLLRSYEATASRSRDQAPLKQGGAAFQEPWPIVDKRAEEV